MKSFIYLLILILCYNISAKDITTQNVSGNWRTSESPYQINCDITIPNNQSLTIEPGVEIVFMGHYMLNVQGQIKALGTANNKIYFHSKNKDEGWLGIRFIRTSIINKKSIIKYSTFEDGNANIFEDNSKKFIGGAIYLEDYSKVLISNNLFQNNRAGAGAAIGCNNSSPEIIYNHFENNCAGSKSHSGYATIECRNKSNPLIVKNIIENNCVFGARYAAGGGIRLVTNSNAKIIENTIKYNYVISKGNLSEGAGLYIHSSNPILVDNLIYGNYIFPSIGYGGAIYFYNSKATLINNRIEYNTASTGGAFWLKLSDPLLLNNKINNNGSINTKNQIYYDGKNSSSPSPF